MSEIQYHTVLKNHDLEHKSYLSFALGPNKGFNPNLNVTPRGLHPTSHTHINQLSQRGIDTSRSASKQGLIFIKRTKKKNHDDVEFSTNFEFSTRRSPKEKPA